MIKFYACEANPPDIKIRNAEENVIKEDIRFMNFFSALIKVRFIPSHREKYFELLFSDNGTRVSAQLFKDLKFVGVKEVLSKEEISKILENMKEIVEPIISRDLEEEKNTSRREIERLEAFFKNSITEMRDELKLLEDRANNILSEANRTKNQHRYLYLIKRYDELCNRIEKLRDELYVKEERLKRKIEEMIENIKNIEAIVNVEAILKIKIKEIQRESIFINEFCKKSVTYLLNPLHSRGIKCRCGKEFVEGYITLEGNLVCPDCALKCKYCSAYVSVYESHGFCNECIAPLCPVHTSKCHFCEKNFCLDHLYKCSFCREFICEKHIKRCYICGKISCSKHLIVCEVCGRGACVIHARSCSECKKECCERCYVRKNDRWTCRKCKSLNF